MENFTKLERIEIKYNLENEVKILIIDLEEKIKEIERLNNKIDKAIEYIKSYNLPEDLGSLNECPISVGELKQLLHILQGEDKE